MQDFYCRINRFDINRVFGFVVPGLVVPEAIYDIEGLDIRLMGLLRNKTTFLRIAYDAELCRVGVRK